MTKHMKKRVLKRFLHAHGIYRLCLNRYDANLTCAKCIPQGYDQETNHWVWVDFLDRTRTSAAELTLGKKNFCILAPKDLEDMSQPSMPLVDPALGLLVDALDGTIPITTSLDDAGIGEDINFRYEYINVDEFSFEKCMIEMDVKLGVAEDDVW